MMRYRRDHIDSMGTWTLRVLALLLVIHSVFADSCVYFNASDLSNQVLVIMRERESHCIIQKTTPVGQPVTCVGNDTAIRLNSTCVLLRREEGRNVTFFLNYGTGNTGESAHPHHADCPASSAVQESQKDIAKPPHERYGRYAAPILAIIIIIIIIIIAFLIYMKLKPEKSSIHCNGADSVSEKNKCIELLDSNSEQVKGTEDV